MGALTIADLTPMAGEPMVADTRLGKALGFAQATHVRRVIRSNQTELLTYGGLYKSVLTSGARGGRPTEGYWLNEAQHQTGQGQKDKQSTQRFHQTLIDVEAAEGAAEDGEVF